MAPDATRFEPDRSPPLLALSSEFAALAITEFWSVMFVEPPAVAAPESAPRKAGPVPTTVT